MFYKLKSSQYIIGLIAISVVLLVASPLVRASGDQRDDDKAQHGVVSVAHPLAAAAGAKILKKGGNAIDAAAAIQFALNVVEPQSSGIGGGGFMMIHLAESDETFIVDSRETAPKTATANMFMFSSVPPNRRFAFGSTSGIAVGVPGTLMGVDTALRKWGTKSLKTVIKPAIQLAKQGFKINYILEDRIGSSRTTLQPETAAVFRPNGIPLRSGDLLKQPDLAKTFKLIADKGIDVFYRGEIATAIVKAQQRSRAELGTEGRGRMVLADLANYRVAIREPTVVNYRDWTIKSMSPPSSGGLTVGQILMQLQQFPIGDDNQGFGFAATKTLHTMIESMRLAYADRAVWMGDEDFVEVPKVGLLNQDYINTRSSMIKLQTRMVTPTAGDPRPYDVAGVHKPIHLAKIDAEEEKGIHTTHFSVVDRWGNVVSYTTTIESTWGTGIMVPGYGFLLNNELTDFNFVPTYDPSTGNPGANDVAPNKRPRSSMAPSIMFKHNQPAVAYGSPGGSSIINSVVNISLNLIDHKMGLQQAIDAPRLSVTSPRGTVRCEGNAQFMQPKISLETQNELRSLGHPMGAVDSNRCTSEIGSVQAVAIDLKTGRQYGAADARREGTVIEVPYMDDDDD